MVWQLLGMLVLLAALSFAWLVGAQVGQYVYPTPESLAPLEISRTVGLRLLATHL